MWSPQPFLAMLRRQNQRWVPILDPNIHVNKGYAAYDSGIARDVFVKDITGHPYVGQVCPMSFSGLGSSKHVKSAYLRVLAVRSLNPMLCCCRCGQGHRTGQTS